MRTWSVFRASGGAAEREPARAARTGSDRPSTGSTTACCSRPMPRPRRWPRSLPRPAWTSLAASTSTSPSGYSPAEIRAAYEIDEIAFSNGTVSGDGAGQTIAIIDAYNDPNIASDLAAFDAEYGLSAPPSFTVDNLGATTTDAGWALETALDVEWAHAIAPDANIVLVEAASDSLQASSARSATPARCRGSA